MRDIEALAPVLGKELLRTPRPHGKRSPELKSDASRTRATAVAFCGAAFAEQAVMRAFGEEHPWLETPSVAAVFDAVLDGSAAAGVVPVENSLAGTIHENYDLFLRYPDLAIVGELQLRIVHCLIAHEQASLDTIRVVRSHPQSLAQCREFLDKHPEWRFEAYNNTTSAVSSIISEGAADVAAIAGESAAKALGLKVLRVGIETNPLNYTRFVIIARRIGDKVSAPPGFATDTPNKASLVFSVPDKPGSLFVCLKILSDGGINMSKLESRPIQGQPWRYLFYLDGVIPEDPADFGQVMEDLKAQTEDFRFLGAYRSFS
jgi:3-deoxy-7-phosphoheptulonate synthase